MFCIYWILHHHPSTVCCWTLCHHSAFISTHAYIRKTFKVSQLDVHYFKYTKRRMEERNKERRKRRKKESKQERARERDAVLMHVYIPAIPYIVELWIFTSYHFFICPKKIFLLKCWQQCFSRFKEKKCFYFPFTFEGQSPWADRFFCCCFPRPPSIWRMSLVYVQLDKNSVVTSVSVSVIFPLCHWFVAIWLCSTFIFFVLSLLASKWVAAYIDVFNQIWTFDEISWIYIKFREISYGF